MQATPASVVERKTHVAGMCRKVMLTTVLMYFVGLVVLVMSGNAHLFPTVVMRGSSMLRAA
jgi:hypothetical protein